MIELCILPPLLLFSSYIKSASDCLADEWRIYNQDSESLFCYWISGDFEPFSAKADLEQ